MALDTPGKGYAATSGVASNGKGVCAAETLLLAGANPANGDTVTIDGKTYTFQTTLTDVDGNVLIGATVTASRDNLAAAINLDAGAGTLYASLTTLHPSVHAIPSGTVNMIAEANDKGTAGNSIAIAETFTDAMNQWTADATNLSGGLDGMTWRVPIVIGASDGLELKTEGMALDSQLINSEGATGVRSRVTGDRGNTFTAGDASFDFLFTGLEVWLGLAFGTVVGPTQQSAENAWLKVFQPAVDLTGLMGTFVIDKNVSVWEFPSVKVNSMTISASAGELTDLTVNVVASNLNRNNFLGTNNKLTIPLVTRPTGNRRFLLFEQLAINLKSQSAAFADSNLIYPNSFSITINNNMAADQVTTRYGREIDEATEDGFFDVTGTMEFPLYEEETIIDASQTKDLLCMRAEFLGPVVEGASTVRNRMTLYIPELQIATASPNIGGPGRIGFSAEFTAARGTSDPTGFPTGYGSNALNLELVNNLNVNPILSQ